jgi:hypothetical protein
LIDVGAFLCSWVNVYYVGQIISLVIFLFHLLTFVSDIIVRSCKVKGRFRSVTKLATVTSSKLLTHLVFQLEDLASGFSGNLHSAGLLSAAHTRRRQVPGAMPCQLERVHPRQQGESVPRQ